MHSVIDELYSYEQLVMFKDKYVEAFMPEEVLDAKDDIEEIVWDNCGFEVNWEIQSHLIPFQQTP